jgi:predicted nucleic acid-binding protein
MNGISLLVDTNVLIDLSEGRRQISKYVQGNHIHISIITEIELLGWPGISNVQKTFFKNLIADCTVVDLSQNIKEMTIGLKQRHKIKLPDAVIAATATFLDIPLLTRDAGFEKIKSLNLLLIE